MLKYAHYEILVKGYVDRVVLCHQQKVVAEHRRSWDKEGFFFNYLHYHYLPLLEQKPGALDHARPLDEPTSTLDAKSEYALYKNFHEITFGKSAILISHRLSTVKMADRIYVIDKGRIIEEGKHSELISKNGKYAYLYDLQAQQYR